MKTTRITFILCWLLIAANAHAWWDSEWTIRRKIAIDPAAVNISEPVGSAAVLIRLHDGNFNFAAAKEDGGDIRFVAADDKTVLPFHIEKFDGLLNEAFVWVKVSDIKPSTAIWLYYGNGGSKAIRSDDVKGTFDADTVLVYHFAERGAPAGDSSGNSNNAQNAGTSIEGSMIGAGLRLSGQSVTIPASASLEWSDGAAMTWSAWIKFTAAQPNAVIFSRRESGKSFVIGMDNGAAFVDINGTRSGAGAAIAPNAWHQLAVVAGDGKVALFVDGESYGSVSAALPALNSPSLIGGDTANGDTGFNGELDELAISKAARPIGAIKFAAISQGGEKAAKLFTFGEDEQQASWLSWLNGGFLGVILKSLTVDGWIVIGILGVMMGISWLVMVSKNGYLNEVAKGNKCFMKEWDTVTSDLAFIETDDDQHLRSLGGRVGPNGLRLMRKSPIFHIYQIGVREVRERIVAGGARTISALSIQAVRATMDGTLVRETQKLNSQIVVLTLSISGGPFLGLLGTVVGVMITFAAIAMQGDVNVNAIAPGIAAALAATVAGLAVAIPALFGYNYLLSRIKDATSDMHVFIDEFVTLMAEFYSDQNEAKRYANSPAPAPIAPQII